MVLARNLEGASFDYDKSDFLAGLQEIRERTFKPKTILSAWEKTGISPYEPSQVLSELIDPLSSSRDQESLNKH